MSTAGISYETHTVEVAGGRLHVGVWPGAPGAPVAVAVHGITGTHQSWPLVAAELAGAVTLIAPDLRGRGRSNELPGPFGMAAHAADVIAVLDHFGVDTAMLAGHSMGGFVSAVAAMNHPDRVRGLLLVDGGLTLAPTEPVDVDAILAAVVGPAVARLAMTFASRAEYHEFWRAHPSIGPYWNDAIAGYVDYDIVGEPPDLRSSVSIDAVRADAADTLLVDDARVAPSKLQCPAVLLRAERGMLDEPQPLYSDALVDAVRATAPRIEREETVAGTNHYTITLSRNGAAAVAEHLAAAS